MEEQTRKLVEKDFRIFYRHWADKSQTPSPLALIGQNFFKTKFSLFETTVFFNSSRHFVDLTFRRSSSLKRLSFDYLTHIEFVYNTRVDVEKLKRKLKSRDEVA